MLLTLKHLLKPKACQNYYYPLTLNASDFEAFTETQYDFFNMGMAKLNASDFEAFTETKFNRFFHFFLFY